ncbi:hypothetical protein QJS10_CPA03g00571 [Acorus calamus]|uniref:Uncharacterized protein n=1 Tax=Acorus calamus TaxID=4465 RepID=A0AAV9F8X2_ACOCL|nr:hypothetical protein QJS10_CPA03g00571 [Acorus calamus]
MAQHKALVFSFIFVLLISAHTIQARKLLGDDGKGVQPQSLEGSLLFMNVLPRGSLSPPSSPSRRGHRMEIRSVDRILRSVPSPGDGH